MTEALDLDAIEDSYLGYDPDYPAFRLIAAVREGDAEIARLRAVIHGQGLSMAAMSKEIRERDAKIARLRAPPGADVLERASLTGRQTMNRITVIIDSKALADILREHIASAFPGMEFVSCDDSGSEILVHLRRKDETPAGPGSVIP